MAGTGVAVVTGAGSGIGRAAAHGPAQRRVERCVAAGRRERAAEGDAKGRRRALAVPTDITDPASVEALFAAYPRGAAGSFDLLFNNAGSRCARGQWPNWRSRTGSASSTRTSPARSCAPGPRSGRDGRAGSRAAGGHRQRLDLGLRPAAVRDRLQRDQARGHGHHEVARARGPRVRHRLRPDRHRQRRDRHDRAL